MNDVFVDNFFESILPKENVYFEIPLLVNFILRGWMNKMSLLTQETKRLAAKQAIACYPHYNDVIMWAIASQITSLMIVYSTVYPDADKKNTKAPRHWPLCGEFTGDRWIPRTNGQ